jgi:hypothetical protein
MSSQSKRENNSLTQKNRGTNCSPKMLTSQLQEDKKAEHCKLPQAINKLTLSM